MQLVGEIHRRPNTPLKKCLPDRQCWGNNITVFFLTFFGFWLMLFIGLDHRGRWANVDVVSFILCPVINWTAVTVWQLVGVNQYKWRSWEARCYSFTMTERSSLLLRKQLAGKFANLLLDLIFRTWRPSPSRAIAALWTCYLVSLCSYVRRQRVTTRL